MLWDMHTGRCPAPPIHKCRRQAALVQEDNIFFLNQFFMSMKTAQRVGILPLLRKSPPVYAVTLAHQQFFMNPLPRPLAGQLGNHLIKGPGHQIAQQGEIIVPG